MRIQLSKSSSHSRKGFSKSALKWSEEDFQDDNIAKLSKERKAQEEANKKLQVRH